MATYKSGAITDGVAGSIGGTVWRDSGGMGTIQSRNKPVSRQTNYMSDSRNMMARAALSWAALSDEIREQWATVGVLIGRGYRWGRRMPMSGYQAYVRAWRLQVGRAVVDVPVVPSIAEYPEGLTLTIEGYGDDLWLMGYGRDLGVGETAIHRVMRESSTANMSWRRRVHRYVEVDSGGWLGAQVERAQRHNGVSSTGIYEGSFATATPKTVEMWIRADTEQTGVTAQALCVDGTDLIVYVLREGTSQVRNFSTYVIMPTLLTDGHWHYVVIVIQDGAGGCYGYTDGELWPASGVGFEQVWNVKLSVGSNGAGAAWMTGDIDSIRISNKVRTADEVAANWAGGAGRRMADDANTLGLWRMDAVDGGLVLDESGRDKHLTATDLADAPGMGSRLIYAGAESAMTVNRGVPIETVIYDPSRLLRAPVGEVVAWD